jgi:hypothetical protein
MSSSNGLNLISPSFPNEYPNNVNCTCTIQPTEITQSIIIDVEVEIKDFKKIKLFILVILF